jgi:hypothetical protein
MPSRIGLIAVLIIVTGMANATSNTRPEANVVWRESDDH